MNLFFLKHEKKVYLDLKEALLIRREENVLILRRLCTDFQKRRKCTKFEKLMYSALHRNSPFAWFIKSDVALAWLNTKFSSMAHLN